MNNVKVIEKYLDDHLRGITPKQAVEIKAIFDRLITEGLRND